MSSTSDDGPPLSLAFLLLLLAVLIVLALGWCMLSSCIGKPMRRALSELWEAGSASARSSNVVNAKRRRDYGAESEIWEMEARGRGG